MDCSIPGFPVHHQLLELAQTHVHQVSDVIHPLLSPSPPAFNLSQHQGFDDPEFDHEQTTATSISTDEYKKCTLEQYDMSQKNKSMTPSHCLFKSKQS